VSSRRRPPTRTADTKAKVSARSVEAYAHGLTRAGSRATMGVGDAVAIAIVIAVASIVVGAEIVA